MIRISPLLIAVPYGVRKHLSELRRSGLVDWYDRQISAGYGWAGQIDEHLNSADIILLPVSADFLASDYCLTCRSSAHTRTT